MSHHISVLFLLFPEPSYSGPDEVKFFRGPALEVGAVDRNVRTQLCAHKIRKLNAETFIASFHKIFIIN